MLGDFTEVLMSSDKLGGNSTSIIRSSHFKDFLAYCQLTDLGYCGSKYPWTNKRKRKAMIIERLDRLFANSDWFSLFPNCYVQHLARMHSDQSPLLLETDKNIRMKPPFRYEHIWSSHPSFSNLVESLWTENILYLDAIRDFQSEASYWNKNVFGYIFYKRKKILATLGRIQRFFENREQVFFFQIWKRIGKWNIVIS